MQRCSISGCVIGKYFTDLPDAQDYAKKQGKLYGERFVIIQSGKDIIVISERQLNAPLG